MIRTASAIEQVSISEQERLHDQHQSSIINQMLQKLSTMDLPEQERVQCYMRHKWRLNHKPNSLKCLLWEKFENHSFKKQHCIMDHLFA
jgi:hypothetical protein